MIYFALGMMLTFTTVMHTKLMVACIYSSEPPHCQRHKCT